MLQISTNERIVRTAEKMKIALRESSQEFETKIIETAQAHEDGHIENMSSTMKDLRLVMASSMMILNRLYTDGMINTPNKTTIENHLLNTEIANMKHDLSVSHRLLSDADVKLASYFITIATLRQDLADARLKNTTSLCK